jgi:hypothetical protein
MPWDFGKVVFQAGDPVKYFLSTIAHSSAFVNYEAQLVHHTPTLGPMALAFHRALIKHMAQNKWGNQPKRMLQLKNHI